MAKVSPRRYPLDAEVNPRNAAGFGGSTNESALRTAKAKGSKAVEEYYGKLATARKGEAKVRAREVKDEYKLRRSLNISGDTRDQSMDRAKSSNVLSRKALGPGVTSKGEFVVGPLKTDESRNLSRAKNAQLKAIAMAKAKKGK